MHLRRLTARTWTSPLIALAALYVGAGGLVHLLEWRSTYRFVPAELPGSALVRIGFPVNFVTSLVLVAALVATLFAYRRLARWVVAAALAFQLVSVALVVLTRTGSVAGWMEPEWTDAADQALVVGLAAAVLLAGAVVARLPRPSWPGQPGSET